ncbi:MAG TPA: glycosyltransferase family 2 protein, partial [Thermoanaerobaculia bacterium]|nr:glycosyltransferase family 2 protein [Thermoanaerobaculia bacterium]
LLAQTYPNLEIIVVNDRSTDATGEILGRIDDPRLIVIHGEEPPAGWLGKPWALHEGSRRATGELLLFVDADVIYAPDAIAAAGARLNESNVAMIAVLPHFEMHGFGEHLMMPMLAVMAFCFMPIAISNRTRIAILGIGSGTGNLLRREIYDAVGGHEALKAAVVDDVALAQLVRRGGNRTEVVRADDVISIRMYHGTREIIQGFTKNLFSVFNRSYAITIGFNGLAIVFHILPFVLAALGNVIAIITLAVIALTRLLLFISLRYRIDNALLGHLPMILIWCVVVIRSVWHTGIRRRVLWRGRTYDAAGTKFGG